MIRKTFTQVKNDPQAEYESQKERIEELLKQIQVGLVQHDRRRPGSAHWGHVGDLASIADTLTDLKDRLHSTGEYAR